MFSRRTASILVAVSLASIAMAITSRPASAQTTVFTYQGILTDGAGPANGLYDGEFKLFDTSAVGTGTQIGPTIQRLNFSVNNGAFTIQLDFGSCASCFNGASRYLEIGIFFGQAAGYSSTTGARNSFFGSFAGTTNTTGADNSFFGYAAGGRGGNKNSFFGSLAGADSTGTGNSFFVFQAGRRSTTGVNNSFYGQSSGFSNTTGYENAFFGDSAGYSNTGGRFNAFFGDSAGHDNIIGEYNTFVGVAAGYKRCLHQRHKRATGRNQWQKKQIGLLRD